MIFATAASPTTQSWITLVLYFGVFMLIFYFLVIMPRKKQEKKLNQLIAELKRGDKVVTIGGIRGEVSKVKEDSFIIKVSENTEVEFIKKAIAYRIEE